MTPESKPTLAQDIRKWLDEIERLQRELALSKQSDTEARRFNQQYSERIVELETALRSAQELKENAWALVSGQARAINSLTSFKELYEKQHRELETARAELERRANIIRAYEREQNNASGFLRDSTRKAVEIPEVVSDSVRQKLESAQQRITALEELPKAIASTRMMLITKRQEYGLTAKELTQLLLLDQLAAVYADAVAPLPNREDLEKLLAPTPQEDTVE